MAASRVSGSDPTSLYVDALRDRIVVQQQLDLEITRRIQAEEQLAAWQAAMAELQEETEAKVAELEEEKREQERRIETLSTPEQEILAGLEDLAAEGRNAAEQLILEIADSRKEVPGEKLNKYVYRLAQRLMQSYRRLASLFVEYGTRNLLAAMRYAQKEPYHGDFDQEVRRLVKKLRVARKVQGNAYLPHEVEQYTAAYNVIPPAPKVPEINIEYPDVFKRTVKDAFEQQVEALKRVLDPFVRRDAEAYKSIVANIDKLVESTVSELYKGVKSRALQTRIEKNWKTKNDEVIQLQAELENIRKELAEAREAKEALQGLNTQSVSKIKALSQQVAELEAEVAKLEPFETRAADYKAELETCKTDLGSEREERTKCQTILRGKVNQTREEKLQYRQKLYGIRQRVKECKLQLEDSIRSNTKLVEDNNRLREGSWGFPRFVRGSRDRDSDAAVRRAFGRIDTAGIRSFDTKPQEPEDYGWAKPVSPRSGPRQRRGSDPTF